MQGTSRRVCSNVCSKECFKSKKDSSQELSFLWCRNAIQIRTISLRCNFCRFSKGDGLCSFFIIEGNENLILLTQDRSVA